MVYVAAIDALGMGSEAYRQSVTQGWAHRTGFVPGFLPTVTVSGMTSSYSLFHGRIQGTDKQAGYAVWTIDGESATHDGGGAQDRIDAVVVRVREDSYDQSTYNDVAVTIIKGSESGTPTAPALGVTDLLLADITIPANADAGAPLTSANIDTSRCPGWVVAAGGILPLTQNDPDDGDFNGQWRDNAGVQERWDGSAWSARSVAANPAARLYYAGTGQQINNTTSTQLTGLTADYALGGMTAVSDAITVPVAGVYSIQARAAFNGTSSAMPPTGRYICLVYLNGSASANEVVRWEEIGGSTDYPTPNGATSLKLNAGDVLTLWGYQNTGSNNVFSRGSAASYHACYLAVSLVSQ